MNFTRNSNTTNGKYYVILDIVSPDGKHNQVVNITETEHLMNAEKRSDEQILYHSDYPFGKGCTIVKKYDFGITDEKLLYYISHDSDRRPMINDQLSLCRDIKWNNFVHEKYSLELQIWCGEKMVDTLKMGPVGSLPIISVKRTSHNYEYDWDILGIPNNPYGLIGFEFIKECELFTLQSIYIDRSKIGLYKIVEEATRYI